MRRGVHPAQRRGGRDQRPVHLRPAGLQGGRGEDARDPSRGGGDPAQSNGITKNRQGLSSFLAIVLLVNPVLCPGEQGLGHRREIDGTALLEVQEGLGDGADIPDLEFLMHLR